MDAVFGLLDYEVLEFLNHDIPYLHRRLVDEKDSDCLGSQPITMERTFEKRFQQEFQWANYHFQWLTKSLVQASFQECYEHVALFLAKIMV